MTAPAAPPAEEESDVVVRLNRDLITAVTTLSVNEARFVVDAYYTIQDNRIENASQIRELTKSEEPHAVLTWFLDQNVTLERQLKRALDRWTDAQPVAQWAKSITGIGPCLSAGLLAYIDITRAETAGSIWRYAGYDPTTKWTKGAKWIGWDGKEKKGRPWNAKLKALCWKIGESFVKVQANESDVYGKVYATRKGEEWANNIAGKFRQQAVNKLVTIDIGKTTDAYAWYSGCYTAEIAQKYLELPPSPVAIRAAFLKENKLKPGEGQPMLPPAHIQSRAKRYAVKLFLAHYHHVAYKLTLGKEPPKPYIIEHGGHVHFIKPPHFEDIDPADPEDAYEPAFQAQE